MLTSDDPGQRIPPAAMLSKASVWRDPQFDTVRRILNSPMLQVDVSAVGEAVKVDVRGTETAVLCVNNQGMLPSNTSNLPLKLIVLDCRSMSIEEGQLVTTLPGRSRMTDTPVLLFGEAGAVEEARKGVVRATQSQWAGVVRTFDILTSDSHPQFTCGRRRVTLMMPGNVAPPKLPPIMNLIHCNPQALGWTAIIGLLRPLWCRTEAEAEDTNVEWIYIISDDKMLPVLTTTRLDTSPSVLYCLLHTASSLLDVGQEVGNVMQTAESVAAIPWGDLGVRWHHIAPLFPREEDAHDSDGHATPPPKQAAVRVKPVAKPKVKASPKLRPPKATRVKVQEPAVEEPQAAPATPREEEGRPSQPRSRLATPEPSSREPSRDTSRRERSEDAETERERHRQEDRERNAERARKRAQEDRERREQDREREAERLRERERQRRLDREEDERRVRERDRNSSRSGHTVSRRTAVASLSHGSSSQQSNRGQVQRSELTRRLGRHPR